MAGPPLPGSEGINPSRGVKNGLYVYFLIGMKASLVSVCGD